MQRTRFDRPSCGITNSRTAPFGYLHWSLFDNYEWGTYTPRFGLYSIDFARGTEREVQDPGGDRPAETYAALIQEAREREPDRVAQAPRL